MRNVRPVGIVAFSFGQRSIEEEPSPCNIRLAQITEEAFRSSEYQTGAARTFVVAQWEVARKLQADGFPVDQVVELPQDGSYLDSEGVWDQARQFFYANGVDSVYPVAHPFLHLSKVRKLIKRDGFAVLNYRQYWTSDIGFDRGSWQWWCRSRFHLLFYACLQAVGIHLGRATS